MDLQPHPKAIKRKYFTLVTLENPEEFAVVRCNQINNRGWLRCLYDNVTLQLPPHPSEYPYIVSVSNDRLLQGVAELYSESIRYAETETANAMRAHLQAYLSTIFATNVKGAVDLSIENN